jgi:ADP-ribosylglycohydrolase
MRMSGGGGYLNLLPGQVTDDTQMELALLGALNAGADCDYFPTDRIAANYIEWFDSGPPDVGQTTTYALLGAKTEEDMYQNAANDNYQSLSNGSLMRCVPLAVVLMNKPPDVLRDLVDLEVRLTHSNPIVSECTFLYCLILGILMKRHIYAKEESKTLFALLLEHATHPLIREWIHTAEEMDTLVGYNCIHHEGWVKHAFIFFVFFLKHIETYTYTEAIESVLMLGGDTDTNAKIVGNLFGAYYPECVPKFMSEPVLALDQPGPFCVKKCVSYVDHIHYRNEE